MCHSVQCTVHTSGLMSHVVLCVHAVVRGLGFIHRACMVCKDLRVRPVVSHNYGGHLLCVVHVRVIDGLVNKRLYTVYVQPVCSILLILHASGGCTLSHSYKQLMLNC